MAQRHLLLLIVAASLLSGCTGVEVTEWGNDGVEVDWNGPDQPFTIKTAFGNDTNLADLDPVGCNGTSNPWVITGWVSAIYHFQEGAGPADNSPNRAVSTSVVVEYMTWNDAVERKESGKVVSRVQVKEWGDPLNGDTALPYLLTTAGKPNLDGSGDEDEQNNFAVVGIIPASEDILGGTKAVNWHTPVKISGYLLPDRSSGDFFPTYEGKWVESGGQCVGRATSSTEQGFRGNMVVTSIETMNDDITLTSGYSPPVGGMNSWVFTLLILVVGGGGAVFLFAFSTIMQRQGARAAAEVLLGKEGLAAAKQVISDVKSAKKGGLKSKQVTQSAPQAPKAKVKKEKEVEIKGFDLQSVISSDAPAGGGVEASGGGVMRTDEAVSMDEQVDSISYDSQVVDDRPFGGGVTTSSHPSGPSAGVVSLNEDPPATGKRAHFSAAMSGSKSSGSGLPEKKSVRKTRKTRRAVKPAVEEELEPESEPQSGGQSRSRPSVSDDDFEDFSL